MSIEKRQYFFRDSIGLVGKEEIVASDYKLSSSINIKSLNSISKYAILIVLAGYLCNDEILINSNAIKSRIDLNKFANLNLNFSGRSSRKFNIIASYRGTNQLINHDNLIIEGYEGILLVSGGIESIATLLFSIERKQKLLPIWVNFGQRNWQSEELVIDNIARKLNIKVIKFEIGLNSLVVKNWNKWGCGIIPARNFLFVALSSLLLERMPLDKAKIYLCAARGEINSKHNDKSPAFFRDASKILSDVTFKDITVTSMLNKYNKTEIVKYWDKHWSERFDIKPSDAMTCYLGNFCGSCTACVYRSVSFSAAGVEDKNYKLNPFKSKIMNNYYLESYDGWDMCRKTDFLIALGKNIKFLSKKLKVFYLGEIIKMDINVGHRINDLDNIS